MVNSALEVVLGGHAFTALGHETRTRWTTVGRIPVVEAVWWAGGLRVTEHDLRPIGENVFDRRIQLRSVNLAGPENVTLRLSLPPGNCTAKDGRLVCAEPGLAMALGQLGQAGPAHSGAGHLAKSVRWNSLPGRSEYVLVGIVGDRSHRASGAASTRRWPNPGWNGFAR